MAKTRANQTTKTTLKAAAKEQGSKTAKVGVSKSSAKAGLTAETANKQKPDLVTSKPAKKQTQSSVTAKPAKKQKPGSPTAKAAKKQAPGSATAKPTSKSKSKAGIATKLSGRTEASEMIRLLCQQYPDAECELTYGNDFELLTSVILSAQTTDTQVNKVTPTLFARFPTARALAEADIDDIKEIIRPTGYFNAKAKSIQDCAIGIMTKFGGAVPATLEELITLPGVGRKTANVILGVLHKVPAWTVDTHVQRLSHRLGLTSEEDPYKIELDLQKIFAGQDWSKYSITLIWHGRRTCYARNPNCGACPISHICPSSSV